MRPLSALLDRLRLGIRDLGLLVARAERSYARQASAQLLELYRIERREHPELVGRLLYEAVIARRLRSGSCRAAEIVQHAEESFTHWPVERELRFRHVVHYQIFDEYTHLGTERPGTRTNIGVIVARIVPEQM